MSIDGYWKRLKSSIPIILVMFLNCDEIQFQLSAMMSWDVQLPLLSLHSLDSSMDRMAPTALETCVSFKPIPTPAT